MLSLLLLGLVGLCFGQELSDHLYLNILSRGVEGAIESSRRSGLRDIININFPDVCTARACEVCRLESNKELLQWREHDVNQTTVVVAELIDCMTVYGPDRCSLATEAVTVRFNDPSVPVANQRRGVVGVNIFLDDLCDCMDCVDFTPEVLSVKTASLSTFGEYITVEFNSPVFIDALVDREVGDVFPLSDIITEESIGAYLGTAGDWEAKWISRTTFKTWPLYPSLSAILTGDARNGFNLSTVPGALYPHNWAFPHNADPTLAFTIRVNPPVSDAMPAWLLSVTDKAFPKTNCRSVTLVLRFNDSIPIFENVFKLQFNGAAVASEAGSYAVSVRDLPQAPGATTATVIATVRNWIGVWEFRVTVDKVWTPDYPGGIGGSGSCMACGFELGCASCYGNSTGVNCATCLPEYNDVFPSCVKCKAHRQGPKCESCVGLWTGADCNTCPSPNVDVFGTCGCATGKTGPNCTIVACPTGYAGVAPACTCAPGYTGCSWNGTAYGTPTRVNCPAVGYQGTSPSCTCKPGYKNCAWIGGFLGWAAAAPVACPATGYLGTTPNCTCAPGYTGCAWNATSTAWINSTIIDTCAESRCKNNGTCINNAGVSFTCQCTNDYQGPTCDVIKVVRPDLVPDGKAIITGSINVGVSGCTLGEPAKAAFSRVLSRYVPGTTQDDVKVSNYSVSNCTNPGRRLLAAAHVATINYYVLVNRSDADAVRAALAALAANATALAEFHDALKEEGVASEDSDLPEVSPVTQVLPPPTDCVLECTDCNCETGLRNCNVTVEPKNGGDECVYETCSCPTAAAKKKKLSGGAIAGIVIGSVAFVFFVAFFAWYICCKKSKKEPTTNAEETGLAKGETGAPKQDGGGHIEEV